MARILSFPELLDARRPWMDEIDDARIEDINTPEWEAFVESIVADGLKVGKSRMAG